MDTKGLKKVDKALDTLEKKLKKFNGFGNSLNFGIGNFTVDQKKLNLVLGNALDMASHQVTFEISRFSVNQRSLQAALAPHMRGTMNARGGGGFGGLTPAEWDRRQGAMGSAALLRHQRSLELANLRRSHSGGSGVRAGIGFGGFGLSSLVGPAIGVGLGGYGLGVLNRRNQEVQAAELTSEAVTSAAGLPEGTGQKSFDWLRTLANKTGFSYMDAADPYNSFLANSMGTGSTLSQSQNMFKGIAEYSRVMHVTPARQKLIFKAFTDMFGKGKVQSEELTKQLGNSLPGAKPIFAEAWQQFKGGKLTGQPAIEALLASMKKGEVNSADILPLVTKIMERKAAPTIEHASHTSQSEQDRFKNTQDDMVKLANESGVEEGFARIFRTLNGGLGESGDLVKKLAEGFNEATKWADDLLLWPQSFARALEGKDSLVADWLGADKAEQLRKDWTSIKQIFTDISALKFDFLPNLEATSKEIASIMNAIAEFQRWKTGTLPSTEANNSSTEKANFLGFEYASPAAIVGDVIKNTGFNMNKARERGRAVYEDPTSLYYHDAAGYDDQQAEMAKAAADDKAMGIVNNNSNQIDIVVNVDGSTLTGMDAGAQAHAIGQAVADMFVTSFDQVNVQFPVKQ